MKTLMTSALLVLFVLLFCFSGFQADRLTAQEFMAGDTAIFDTALQNGQQAREGFVRCNRYMFAWLAEADSISGLIPRNLNERYWNAQDCAADNYPFMVLTSAAVNPFMFETRMRIMLEKERQITSRVGHLSATYSFTKQDFLDPRLNKKEILFGNAEYMKDGLLPITEFLGKSPWSDRMLEILDDLIDQMQITPELLHQEFGYFQAIETSGDMLQVLARMYWFTRNEKYLNKGIEFADYYLSEKNLPSNNPAGLPLKDHGCEIIGGLTEMYHVVKTVKPEKYQQWKPFIHALLDTVLAKGRNEDGLFYIRIDPVSGQIVDKHLSDNWGYTYNGIYTVYQLDGTPEYRDAVLKVLKGVAKYRNYMWEQLETVLADGYADSIEGAMNLHYYEPLPETADWIESEIKVMWSKQQPNGMIEGWHGDGNFARTTLMYCLWKTSGAIIENWNRDIVFGSVIKDRVLYLALTSPKDWTGKIKFAPAFHKVNLNMPANYPRINQFQEWFPIDKDKEYLLLVNGNPETVKGTVLLSGYPVSISGGAAKEPLQIRISLQ